MTPDLVATLSARSYASMKVSIGGDDKTIDWVSSDENRQHSFKITGIKRGNAEQKLKIKWDGSPIDVDVDGSLTVKIPEKGFFGLVSHRLTYSPEQAVYIYFSDPLEPKQDLRGLVQTNHAGASIGY